MITFAKRSVKRKLLSVVLFIAALCGLPAFHASAVYALNGVETQLTTNTADQTDPAISGNRVVYTDARNGNLDIYVYDVVSHAEFDLTPGTPNDQYLNDIDGSRVVYTNVTAAGGDIYLYDLSVSMSTPLTAGSFAYGPTINGNHVVWVEVGASYRNVILADISAWTKKTITADPVYVDAPRVDGDWVVWEELIGAVRQIRAYRISTGEYRTLTSDPSDHRRPDVSGNLVVWADHRNGNWDIYSYDLNTGIERQVTSNSADQQYPRIDGTRVVWEDSRSGIPQIWTIDLNGGTEEVVSPSIHYQVLDSIDQNHIVWAENRYGNYDIFMFTIQLANQPPTANAGPDQTVHVGSLVTLDGSGSSDPDGNVPLTYAWSFVSRPAGSSAVLSNPTAVNPTVTPDFPGNYVIQLVVKDSLGAPSSPATVTISTTNTAPVADAGPDQAVTVIGSLIQLDGSKSYDPDGDPITYQWSFSSIPAGSAAILSSPTSSTPTFTADVHGTYIVQLTVSDPWTQSLPATVTISFSNVKPVANAGLSQSAFVGTTVTLNGSGSFDANGDPLTYQWSLASVPQGSQSVIASPTSAITTFVPDLPGLYVAQLVVNDGFINSDPSTVQVQVISNRTEAIDAARALESIIAGLSPSAFKNPNMQNALINKLNAVIASINSGNYADALGQLQNDILSKTDGCAKVGTPDRNDWIINCESQGQVYPAVMNLVQLVQGML